MGLSARSTSSIQSSIQIWSRSWVRSLVILYFARAGMIELGHRSIRRKARSRGTDAAEPANTVRRGITRLLRLIDNALEYGLAHALGGQAATVQNVILTIGSVHFTFGLGAVETGGLPVTRGSSRTRRRATISSVKPSSTFPA